MQDIAPASFFPQSSIPSYNHSILHTLNIECAICTQVPERPLELACGSIVCAACCCKWVQISCDLTCPCCHTSMPVDKHLQRPSEVTMSVLGSLVVDCNKGCNRSVRASDYRQHLEAQCKQYFVQSTVSPSRVTIGEILSKTTETPITPVEKRVAATVIRWIMSENPDNSVIKIPTQGQVSIIQHLILKLISLSNMVYSP